MPGTPSTTCTPRRRVAAARGRPECRQLTTEEIQAVSQALQELEVEARHRNRLPRGRPVRPQLWRDLRLLVRLGATTGLRVSEMLSRQVSHVVAEPDATRLEIHRAKKRGKAQVEHLWITNGLGEDLARHAELRHLEGGVDAYLFATSSGKPYDQANLSRAIHRAIDRAGVDIGDRQTFHALRHHSAWRVFDETRDVNRVRALLGHASISQTAIYLGIGVREQERLNREAMAGVDY